MKPILLLMLVAFQVQAAEVPPGKLTGEMEGVYKCRFTNAIITHGKALMEADNFVQAEDIVEIVRYDDTHVHVRDKFQFYNGHSCSIAGIAGYENSAFV
jgi:hypothetical protein